MDKLLLTEEEQGKVRAKIPGTTNVIEFAREVSKRIAKAQLDKAQVLKAEGRRELIEFLAFNSYKQFPKDEDLHLNYIDWHKLQKEIGE